MFTLVGESGVEALLKVTNDFGKTPLSVACEHGHDDLARIFITAGADVNHPDKNGNTPLMLAAKNGSDDVATTLIKKKADVKAVNNDGKTAMHIAAEGFQVTPLHPHSPLLQDEVCYILGMNGGDITIRYLVKTPSTNKKKKVVKKEEESVIDFFSHVDHFGFYTEEKEKLSFQQFLNAQAETLSPFFKPKDPKKEAEAHKKQLSEELKRSKKWAPMIKDWQEAQKEQLIDELKPKLKEFLETSKDNPLRHEKHVWDLVLPQWSDAQLKQLLHNLKNNPQYKSQLIEDLRKGTSIVKTWGFDKKKAKKVQKNEHNSYFLLDQRKNYERNSRLFERPTLVLSSTCRRKKDTISWSLQLFNHSRNQME
jgi:hypothetical protein